MDQTLPWIALVGGEILAVVFILLFIAWFLGVRQKGRDRKAINELVSRLASERDTRRETLKSMLGTNFALSGPTLDRTAAELLNAELRLVNIFSQVYLQRLADEAAVFDKSIGASVDAYHKLSGSGPASITEVIEASAAEDEAAAPSTEEADGEDELSFLRAENKRLTEELRVTMETMSRMLNEYSTMFASDGEEEVNVVMDVDEAEATDAAIPEPADSSKTSGVLQEELVEAAATDEQAAVTEMAADQSSPEVGMVDPDEILAAASTTAVGDVVEDDLSAVADVPEMAETSAGDAATTGEEAVDELADAATGGSPYDLLEDAEEAEKGDPLDLVAGLEEAVDDAPVDDIDALLAETQGAGEGAGAESDAVGVSTPDPLDDLNEDLADLFDDDEVAAGEQVVDEDLFDLTADETASEKKA